VRNRYSLEFERNRITALFAALLSCGHGRSFAAGRSSFSSLLFRCFEALHLDPESKE